MSLRNNQQNTTVDGLQIPGLVQDQETVEQLSFTIDPLTPVPQSNGPHLADSDTTPQPASQAGISEAPPTRPVSASYMSGPGSLAGLADFETAHQPVPQVAFPTYASGPSSLAGLAEAYEPFSQSPTAGSGSALVPQDSALAGATRSLPESQPGIAETRPDPRTTASRPPVIIRGSNQQRTRSIRPPQGRRHVISIGALSLLLIITLGTLFAVSPLGRDVRASMGIQIGGPNISISTPSNMNLVAQATATAVVHQQNDGVDPSANGGGAILAGSGSGSLNWPYGYCTYWANLRYHQLTGHWVSWHGNADAWVSGARLAGWNVSTSPHVPSILVLMPGVQGASGVGHVAVVESASGNVVHTSNMNWYTNGGGFGIVSYQDFTTGSGVYFIWE